MPAIAFNGHVLHVAAIVQRGRLLVPARAFFAAAGLADRGGDSKNAYVPLRDIARRIGATIRYDAASKMVSVTMPGETARQQPATVTALTPAPDAAVDSAYPAISASLKDAAASQQSVTLTVDGTDVTQTAAFDGSTITYLPRTGLSRGLHTIVFSGHTTAQQPFSQQWSFTTNLSAPPDASAFDPSQFRFYTSGPAMYRAGDWMHFTLIAPPNGSAALRVCGLGEFPFTGSMQSELYVASIPAPPGFWIPSCEVTAVYTGWNGTRTYVPIPVYVALYTRANPARTPRPRVTSRPIQPEPRKPEPTAAPAPTPRFVPPPRPARTPAPAVPHPRRTPHS